MLSNTSLQLAGLLKKETESQTFQLTEDFSQPIL